MAPTLEEELDVLDLADTDVPQALRSYTAHKRWATRYLDTVDQLIELLQETFSNATLAQLDIALTKFESQVARLGQYSDILVQENFPKAKDHSEEVQDLEKVVKRRWKDYHIIANKAATANAPAMQEPVVNRPAAVPKIASDLKPEALQVDASAADLRQWKRQFQAFYSASNLASLKMADQIAYLETCLSKDLAKYIARETTATTPIIGDNSCFSLLDAYFNRKYPILLRRKNFFAMHQQAGQDERAFIEELQAVAEEADIASMSLEDSLCLMMLAGLTDKKLVEKLSEQEDPRFTAFKRIVDAHLHAKATGQGQAGTFKTSSSTEKKKGGNNRPPNPSSSQRREPSDREKKRRAALAGKCYRCGSSEHLGSGCSVKRDHICNKCKGKGHIPQACFPSAARATAAADQPQASEQQLQLEYQPEQSWTAHANAMRAQAAANSRPTPPILL